MRFPAGEARKLAGITTETLRHWKRVLPPLFGRDGRSEGYTFAEVVILAVIARAVQELSVSISQFTPVAEQLFAEIVGQVQADSKPLLLCITGQKVAFVASDQLPEVETMAVVRVEPILQRIRQAISGEPLATEAQLDLPFDGARVVGLRALRFSASR